MASDRETVEMLKAREIEKLIETLKPFSLRYSDVESAIGYFDRNREQMRYRDFRNQGLCVSSAAVEAGCRNVISVRLKRGGMHWSKAWANKIAALRASIISERFDDFWYARTSNS